MRIIAVFPRGFALLLLACCCACAGKAQNPGPPSAESAPWEVNLDLYNLVPGDEVKVDVFREKDLSRVYTVEPDGRINFPLLGRIPAAGQNTSTLEKIIARGLSQGFLVDPDVRISVTQYRPIYVGGEVTKPGEYPFKSGMTAQQAVTLAGGTTRFAAEDKIYLQRYGQDAKQRQRVTPGTLVYPGDIITVEERLF